MMKNRTEREQKEVELSIQEIFTELYESKAQPYLYREEHIFYLYKSLTALEYNIRYYDTGHPWVIYWILNGLSILEDDRITNPALQKKMIKFLSYCQYPEGGFCGGHGQMPQMASTYAAILSLLIIGTEEAYQLIDRKGIYRFLMDMKNKDGSFTMARRGEIDMRGSYIAVILSSVLNIQTPELLENVGDYIGKCQTYEGGIGPVPESEAHGGLTYCAVAALVELKQLYKVNVQKLTYWGVNRQMKMEGGFQGRTNKLVDNCYSFWQGALHNLLALGTSGKIGYKNELISHQRKLQMYVLICQEEDGGLIDKPGKRPDLYHTCYSLSGLALSQQRPENYNPNNQNKDNAIDQDQNLLLAWDALENKVQPTDPIYNIPPQKLQQAKTFFSKQASIQQLLTNKE